MQCTAATGGAAAVTAPRPFAPGPEHATARSVRADDGARTRR